MIRKALLTLFVIGLSLQTAFAGNGFYVGGSFQFEHFSVSDFQGVSVDFEDDRFGYRITGGYQFHDLGINFLNYFSVEASWQEWGNFRDDIRGLGGAGVDIDGLHC